MFRILTLDGGGAKGFYTLGVLREIEGITQRPLAECFDLVFGTSTGSIIAALICLGKSVDEIRVLYERHVPRIMRRKTASGKTKAINELSTKVFGDLKFDAFQTDIGIVATQWMTERPMIFKTSIGQAQGSTGTFEPGFGVRIGDAVHASCAAYPFIKRKFVVTSTGSRIELVDGGYCANNPTLFALADAIRALEVPRADIRIVSLGVGEYPKPKKSLFTATRWLNYLPSVRLVQKVMEISTQSMDQLRDVLFKDIHTVRISEAFTQPEMATDLFEHDLEKLNLLWQRGRQSFRRHEAALRQFL